MCSKKLTKKKQAIWSQNAIKTTSKIFEFEILLLNYSKRKLCRWKIVSREAKAIVDFLLPPWKSPRKYSSQNWRMKFQKSLQSLMSNTFGVRQHNLLFRVCVLQLICLKGFHAMYQLRMLPLLSHVYVSNSHIFIAAIVFIKVSHW